jgi:hypothetical protein
VELSSQSKNKLIWQGLTPLLWFFLILTTLNLSTGAVIVLVASGPNGESLGDDATTIPLGEVRLLHLELFGGIIHLHPTTPGTTAQPVYNHNVIDNAELVQSFDSLFPALSASANYLNSNPNPIPDFSPQKHNNTLTGEKPGPAGLKKSDKIITSSSTETGFSRVLNPNFKETDQTVIILEFDMISPWTNALEPLGSGIFPYPPEKPPRNLNLNIPA